MSWFSFYESRMDTGYLEYLRRAYEPLVQEVSAGTGRETVFAELGCGAANISRLVSEVTGSMFYCLDACKGMLSLAQTVMQGINHRRILGDVRNPVDGRFDVVFSHGVLEHFNDGDIRTIIGEQKKVSRKIVHYVPTNGYKTASYGDERLMSAADWIRIAGPDRIRSFNAGRDLLLIFES